MISLFYVMVLLVASGLAQELNEYDFRKEFPVCVNKTIPNRKDCASSWAIGLAGVIGDRFCRSQNKTYKLSPKSLICKSKSKCVGNFDIAELKTLASEGLTTEKCFPYEKDYTVCPTKCANDEPIKRYQCENLEKIEGVDNIKKEIVKNGPVLCVFEETKDHDDYYDGIYYKSTVTKAHDYLTAYKLVGFGLENGIKYWIGEQSLGEDFGENGYIRYKIQDDLCKSAYL